MRCLRRLCFFYPTRDGPPPRGQKPVARYRTAYQSMAQHCSFSATRSRCRVVLCPSPPPRHSHSITGGAKLCLGVGFDLTIEILRVCVCAASRDMEATRHLCKPDDVPGVLLGTRSSNRNSSSNTLSGNFVAVGVRRKSLLSNLLSH